MSPQSVMIGTGPSSVINAVSLKEDMDRFYADLSSDEDLDVNSHLSKL